MHHRLSGRQTWRQRLAAGSFFRSNRFAAGCCGPIVIPTVAAASKERIAAMAQGDGDVAAFHLALILSTALFAALAVVAAFWARRKARRQAAATPAGTPRDWSAGVCLVVSAAIALASLALSGAVTLATTDYEGYFAASSEGGPIENMQIAVWGAALVVAAIAIFTARGREARAVLLALAIGAALAGAREADLHEWLTPKGLGAWGVHYRSDWWKSKTAPVLPRVMWGAILLTIVAGGVMLARRSLPGLLAAGRPMRRLIPLLAIVAGLLFVGFALDDLARYHWNMRQKQVCEEDAELAGAVVYLGCVVWGAKLARRIAAPSQSGDGPLD